jgi:hypothetical protein
MVERVRLGMLSFVVVSFLIGCGSSNNNNNNQNSDINSANSNRSSDNNSNNRELATKVGYFIDSPVAGLNYKTTSGAEGVTDKEGRFRYKEGDSVEFKIGNLALGETTPKDNGIVTPNNLAKGDSEVKLLILRVLQSLDSDNNTSNGITIPKKVTESLKNIEETDIRQLSAEDKLLELDTQLALAIDEDEDGVIDVDDSEAITHFEESTAHLNQEEDNRIDNNGNSLENEHREENSNATRTEINEHRAENNNSSSTTQTIRDEHENDTYQENYYVDTQEEYDNGADDIGNNREENQEHGNRPDNAGNDNEQNQEHGNRPDNAGNGNEQNQEHGNISDSNRTQESNQSQECNNSVDLNSTPLSTLTPELKDAIAYMGNEERLAYDVYHNLYTYHLNNSNSDIKQLKNISEGSEIKHVGIVQDIVRKYSLNPDDIDIVKNPVATRDVTFENMPSGVYDVEVIQKLYDALYKKGIESKKDALEVGCMVEVTDVNDLDRYIKMADDSNATDIKDAFEFLRNGSYNHYWAFYKGLENLGIDNGCCSLGIIDGVDYCHVEYPQNDKGDSNSENNQGNGQGQGNGNGNGQGQHGRNQ